MLLKLLALYLNFAVLPVPAECAEDIAYLQQWPGYGVEGPNSACAEAWFDASQDSPELGMDIEAINAAFGTTLRYSDAAR